MDSVRDALGDPGVPLWVTEGTKKADCGVHYQLCIVALSGCVELARHATTWAARPPCADWHDIALNGRRVMLAFDGDVARKPSVRQGVVRAGRIPGSTAARKVEYLHLPDTEREDRPRRLPAGWPHRQRPVAPRQTVTSLNRSKREASPMSEPQPFNRRRNRNRRNRPHWPNALTGSSKLAAHRRHRARSPSPPPSSPTSPTVNRCGSCSSDPRPAARPRSSPPAQL